MNIAVVHSLSSIALHELVFRTIAKSRIPWAARVRCDSIADQYKMLKRELDGKYLIGGVETTSEIFAIGDDTLPALDDLERCVDWSKYPREKLRWRLEVLDKDYKVTSSMTQHSAYYFIKNAKAKYGDIPKALVSFAAYAMIGDEAWFYQATQDTLYHAKVSRYEQA